MDKPIVKCKFLEWQKLGSHLTAVIIPEDHPNPFASVTNGKVVYSSLIKSVYEVSGDTIIETQNTRYRVLEWLHDIKVPVPDFESYELPPEARKRQEELRQFLKAFRED